jgi:hyperosmotically inducible periplasmic protein
MNRFHARLRPAAATSLTGLLAGLLLALTGCGRTPGPPTVATMPPVDASAANVVDAEVSNHVKTALQSDAALKAFDIQVITLKGDVRLIGVLDSQAQIDEAIRLARAAEGAHTIHDELTLRK